MIKRFCVYDTATGVVKYTGICNEEDVSNHEDTLLEGESLLEISGLPEADLQTQCYKVTSLGITVAEKVTSRPFFNMTLDLRKSIKKDELKTTRSDKEASSFTWDGSAFDCDPVSQSRIQGAVQLATLSISSSTQFSIDWTLADNSVRTLSASDMVQVGVAMGQHIISTHAVYRSLKADIEAATTAEQINAITWPNN